MLWGWPLVAVATRSQIGRRTTKHTPFCTEHWCKKDSCCKRCSPANATRADGSARPHLMFLHTEKTGGSAVECAALPLVQLGLFSNLGHAIFSDVQLCAARCTFEGTVPQIVLSVREPYAYYRSLYTFAYSGEGAVRTRLGFEEFMEAYVAKPHLGLPGTGPPRRFSQINSITRACGEPCRFHYLLRTECLDADWTGMLRASGISRELFPMLGVSLPRVNPTNLHHKERGASAPTIYSPRVLEIIHKADALLFDQLGYARRVASFEMGGPPSNSSGTDWRPMIDCNAMTVRYPVHGHAMVIGTSTG